MKLEGSSTTLLYFTMPFVEGESLRARLAKGPLPAAEATRVMREVADALDYAHRQNIVHRDIKPDNILLSNGHAVVTDFGVAKALSTATSVEVNTTATSVGTVIGTPAYMAPEQGAGDPDVGPAADIYALGVTGFEMLSGQTPFKGTTPRAILAAQLTSEAPPLETMRQDLSPALPPLVRRLLAKAPEDRPSAATLVGLLDQVGPPAPGTLVTPPMVRCAAHERSAKGIDRGRRAHAHCVWAERHWPPADAHAGGRRKIPLARPGGARRCRCSRRLRARECPDRGIAGGPVAIGRASTPVGIPGALDPPPHAAAGGPHTRLRPSPARWRFAAGPRA